jgi:hypothetical protein
MLLVIDVVEDERREPRGFEGGSSVQLGGALHRSAEEYE